MNTNSTQAEYPLWHRGQIHEPTSQIPHPLQPEHPAPAAASEPLTAQEDPAVERHRRKCTICQHPDCEAIEDSYLNWISPVVIVREFQLGSRSTLYRHAEALGLLTVRRRRMHFALDRMIERADSAAITGNTVIRAIMLSHQLTQQDEAGNPPEITQPDQPNTKNSNRDTKFLESPITRTK
jgi:hypothetical protein